MITYRRTKRFIQPDNLEDILEHLASYTKFEDIFIWVEQLPEGAIIVTEKFLENIADNIHRIEFDCTPRYLLVEDLDLILKTVRSHLYKAAEGIPPSEFLSLLKKELRIVEQEIDKNRLLTTLKTKNWLGSTLLSENNLTLLNDQGFDYLFGDRYSGLMAEQKELRYELWGRVAEIYKLEISSHENEYFSISPLEGLGDNIQAKMIVELSSFLSDLGYVTSEAGMKKLDDSLRMLFAIEKGKFNSAKSNHKNNKNKYGNILRAVEKLS